MYKVMYDNNKQTWIKLFYSLDEAVADARHSVDIGIRCTIELLPAKLNEIARLVRRDTIKEIADWLEDAYCMTYSEMLNAFEERFMRNNGTK